MTANKDKTGFFNRAYDLQNTDQTREFYAQWSQTYDTEIGVDGGYRQPERCAQALAKFVLNKSAPIVDIGCGTGLSGLALRKQGFTNIAGCDLSKEMLAKAEITNCYQRLFEADLNMPPIDIPDNSVDAVAAVGIFSFGHVAPDAIEEFLRILKPQGYFVIGLNDHFYDEGAFPAKLDALKAQNRIAIVSKNHGIHLENVEGSTGWVIVGQKL